MITFRISCVTPATTSPSASRRAVRWISLARRREAWCARSSSWLSAVTWRRVRRYCSASHAVITPTTFTMSRLNAATTPAFRNGGRVVGNQPKACAATTTRNESVAYAVATIDARLENMSAV